MVLTVIFFTFAIFLVWMSFRSFRGGVEYLGFFRSELARSRSEFTPFVTVVAPFRSIDDGIEDNLKALIDQDYPDFEIIFVGDDDSDAAIPIISEIIGDNSSLIVAPKAVSSSQKVENLRYAIRRADQRSEVFAFIDSDVCPGTDWLRCLVRPLDNPKMGAATGYRWFISKHPTVASELRSSWNASIASALGPKPRSNFCWGGSMAIRREIFERLNITDRWKGTLSDDFTVTNVLKEAQLPIVFVPGALTASLGNCSFTEMLEFTTRQMKITRVYSPHLWTASFIGSGIFVLVLTAAFLIVIFAEAGYLRFGAVFTIVAVAVLSVAKAWLRLDAILLALPRHEIDLRRQRLPQCTFWLFTPAIFLYNSLAALLSRRITWRGTKYELKSPVETVIISD